MITRTAEAAGTRSRAVYSPCEAYRYLLTRRWAPGPALGFVMLNPSTATELANDPTIARCEARARAGGFGALRIANLFALRATDPRALRQAGDPVGPGNDAALHEAAEGTAILVAGWGVHGALAGRGATVRTQLEAAGHRLHHLGLTKAGLPRHPLYVPYARGPELWAAG